MHSARQNSLVNISRVPVKLSTAPDTMRRRALENKITAAAQYQRLSRSAADTGAAQECIRAARALLAETWLELESGGYFPTDLVARIMEIEKSLTRVGRTGTGAETV